MWFLVGGVMLVGPPLQGQGFKAPSSLVSCPGDRMAPLTYSESTPTGPVAPPSFCLPLSRLLDLMGGPWLDLALSWPPACPVLESEVGLSFSEGQRGISCFKPIGSSDFYCKVGPPAWTGSEFSAKPSGCPGWCLCLTVSGYPPPPPLVCLLPPS